MIKFILIVFNYIAQISEKGVTPLTYQFKLFRIECGSKNSYKDPPSYNADSFLGSWVKFAYLNKASNTFKTLTTLQFLLVKIKYLTNNAHGLANHLSQIINDNPFVNKTNLCI